MDIKKITSEIAASKMDRKEFLASVGAAALAVVGVSSLLKALHLRSGQGVADNGYGSSSYGGTVKRS